MSNPLSVSTNSSTTTQRWWDLLAIQAGGTMCLPILCIGQLLCAQYGWKGALCAIFTGNALLLIMGLAMASLSTSSTLSTFGHVKEVFGPLFQKALGLLMLVSMLGWFAVQINLMVATTLGASPSPITSSLVMLAIGSCITLLMYMGCGAMRRMALISAPLLAIGLLCFFISNAEKPKDPLFFSLEWMSGVSLVIGAHIAVLVDLPTFFQHARSKRDGLTCIACLYACIVPLVEAGGVWLAETSGSQGLLQLLQPGAGLLISSLFILSGWSANNANLYSAVEASVSMKLFERRTLATLLLGGMGTLLACMNPLQHMVPLLELIGVALGAMGAIMVTQYLCGSEGSAPSTKLTCTSYGLGVLLGALSNGTFTTSTVLDACLIALLAQLGGMYLLNHLEMQRRTTHVSFR